MPKPWPPDHALRKVEELCAIHKANVTVALLFQPATLFVRNQQIALEVKWHGGTHANVQQDGP